MSDHAVATHDLTKIYRPAPPWLRVLLRTQISEPVVALNGVSFAIARGGLCVVAGPNGAGKSTLFRSLVGLVAPTRGSGSVCGFDIERDAKEVRGTVGFMPSEDRTLWLRLSCAENVGFHARLRGVSAKYRRQHVQKVLATVGLLNMADRSCFALSGGMRARLQLACALVGRPQVLILDEPTAQLDPVAARDLAATIRALADDEGMAVLISTHRVDEIEDLGRQVLVMHQGRLIYDGPAEALSIPPAPKVELQFASEDAAVRAHGVLREIPETTTTLEGAGVAVVSREPIGLLLTALDHLAVHLVQVKEHRQALRDSLTELWAHQDRVANGQKLTTSREPNVGTAPGGERP